MRDNHHLSKEEQKMHLGYPKVLSNRKVAELSITEGKEQEFPEHEIMMRRLDKLRKRVAYLEIISSLRSQRMSQMANQLATDELPDCEWNESIYTELPSSKEMPDLYTLVANIFQNSGKAISENEKEEKTLKDFSNVVRSIVINQQSERKTADFYAQNSFYLKLVNFWKIMFPESEEQYPESIDEFADSISENLREFQKKAENLEKKLKRESTVENIKHIDEINALKDRTSHQESAFQDEMNKLLAKLSIVTAELEQLKKENELVASRSHQNLEQELASLKNEYENSKIVYESKYAELMQQNNYIQNQNHQQRSRFQKQASVTEDDFISELVIGENSKSELEKKVLDLKTENWRLVAHCEALEELCKRNNHQGIAEIQDLDTQLVGPTKNSEAPSSELMGVISQTESELETLKRVNLKLENALASEKTKQNSLIAQISELNAEKQAIFDLAKHNEDLLTNTSENVDRKESEITGLHSKIRDLEFSLSEKLLDSKIDEEKMYLAQEKIDLQSNTICQLYGQVQELEAKMLCFKSVDSQIYQTMDQVLKLERKISQVEEETMKDSKCDEVLQNDAALQNTSLADTLSELSEHITDLTIEKKQLIDNEEKLTAKVVELTSHIERLETQLDLKETDAILSRNDKSLINIKENQIRGEGNTNVIEFDQEKNAKTGSFNYRNGNQASLKTQSLSQEAILGPETIVPLQKVPELPQLPRDETDILFNKIENLERRNATLTKALNKAEKEIDQLSEQNHTLEQNTKHLVSAHEVVADNSKNIEDRLDNLLKHLSSENETHDTKNVENKLDRVEKQLLHILNGGDKLKANVKTLKSELHKIDEMLKFREKEYLEKEERFMTLLQDKEKLIADKENEIAHLKRENDKIGQDNEQRLVELDSAKADIVQYEEEVKNLLDDLNDAKELATETAVRVTNIEEMKALHHVIQKDYQDKIETLEDNLRMANFNYTEQCDKFSQLMRKLTEMERQKEKLENDCAELFSELNQSEGQTKTFKKRLEMADMLLERRESVQNTVSSSISGVESEVEGLEVVPSSIGSTLVRMLSGLPKVVLGSEGNPTSKLDTKELPVESGTTSASTAVANSIEMRDSLKDTEKPMGQEKTWNDLWLFSTSNRSIKSTGSQLPYTYKLLTLSLFFV